MSDLAIAVVAAASGAQRVEAPVAVVPVAVVPVAEVPATVTPAGVARQDTTATGAVQR